MALTALDYLKDFMADAPLREANCKRCCREVSALKNRQDILHLLADYTASLKAIYGTALSKVILYGSYARGDYTDDSDIDVMLLLDVSPEEERRDLDRLAEITSTFNIDNDVYIMPLPKSRKTFVKWEGIDPFYKNVNREGVVLFDA